MAKATTTAAPVVLVCGDDDFTVKQRAKKAIEHGIIPILVNFFAAQTEGKFVILAPQIKWVEPLKEFLDDAFISDQVFRYIVRYPFAIAPTGSIVPLT
jgi:hypothetical protein